MGGRLAPADGGEIAHVNRGKIDGVAFSDPTANSPAASDTVNYRNVAGLVLLLPLSGKKYQTRPGFKTDSAVGFET